MQVRVVVVAGALSVVTDFYSVVLPMIVLLRLQISKREKIGLMVVFGVGLWSVLNPFIFGHDVMELVHYFTFL